MIPTGEYRVSVEGGLPPSCWVLVGFGRVVGGEKLGLLLLASMDAGDAVEAGGLGIGACLDEDANVAGLE